MSKDFGDFKCEKGDIAFLAGVVDVISDRLSLLCDYAYTLEADIFPLENNDFSLLNDSIKKRLHHYNEQCGGSNVSNKEIDSLDFCLEKLEINDLANYLHGIIKFYSSNSNISEEVDEFLHTLCWQLQQPLGVYAPIKLPDKNVDVLGKIYLYLAWKYFFISYNNYVVLLIFGTVE